MTDPYVYSGTEVLKNKMNIQNEEELKEIERKITSAHYYDIISGNSKIKKTFDYEHLKSLHKKLFQDIYPWAGKERTVDIAKTMLFCRVIFLEEEAKRIFNRLKKDNLLRDFQDKKEFSEKLATVFLDINMLHPFREGNGRVQRIFIGQLAEENNYTLEWKNLSKEVVDRMSINDDYKEVAKIFMENLKEHNQDFVKKNHLLEKMQARREQEENSHYRGLKK